MNEMSVAIELSAASWEQFIGAALRRTHYERLLAARPRRRAAQTEVGTSRAKLVAMLAVTVVGYWLLRV